MDQVLKPLIEDIKKLEDRYEFWVDGLMETYYGTLALISADNPASSALSGFKEGSSAYCFCCHCLGKAEETRTKFNECSFKLQNRSRHLRHCTKVEASDANSKKYGVNRRALLLELQYFDMCSGALIPDVMHDVLEDITESMELGYMEYSNIPSVVTRRVIKSDDSRLGQNAFQMWLLGMILPFLFGKFVPEGDKCWLNYLLMLEITDFLLAPDISKDEIGYLESLISTHHEDFVKIYPDNTVLPKTYYLIHSLRLILKYLSAKIKFKVVQVGIYYLCKFGPLVKQWTMRYEDKHSYLKRLAQNLGNFTNICWTLVSRHQNWISYHWLCDQPLGQVEPEIGPGKAMNDDDIPISIRTLCNEVFQANWVKVDGTLYKAVVLQVSNDNPQFGQIKTVYVLDTNRVLFYVHLLSASNFIEHYHA